MPDHPTVILVMFNGWGYRPEQLGNVIAAAETPSFDQLQEAYPHLLLRASGTAVGLTEGTVGTAAVGYETIAAGRPVEQPVLRLQRALDSGEFMDNPVISEAARTIAADGDARLHLIGMVSDGQVRSSEAHYFALLQALAQAQVPGDRVFIHAILDGYDTPQRSGLNYLARFAAEMMRTGIGRVATLMGRRYGLPGREPWEAVERAYAALVDGAGRLVPSAIQAIQAGYGRGEDDATLSPSVVLGQDGLPSGCIRPGDQVIVFNHRGDDLQPLLQALAAKDFAHFERSQPPLRLVHTLTSFTDLPGVTHRAAFPSDPAESGLGSHVTSAGKQIALVCESVSEAHVRRLVDGALEPAVTVQTVPSPPLPEVVKAPARVTEPLTQAAVELLAAGRHDLIVVDYVNADLAGHFGETAAAMAAVESLDAALPPLVKATRRAGAVMLLSSCHGNVEEMVLPDSARPNPAHTTNPVPLLLVNDTWKGFVLAPSSTPASLADLGPTILALLGLEPVPTMTGQNLLELLSSGATATATDPPPTTMEISAIEAIGMVLNTERQARAFYLACSARANDLDTSALLRHLADEATQRITSLEQREALLSAGQAASPSPAEDVPLPPLLAPDLTPLDLLEAAIAEELETYRTLTEMAARNVDPQGRAVLEQLAGEEVDLLRRLQRLSESEAIRLLAGLGTGRAAR